MPLSFSGRFWPTEVPYWGVQPHNWLSACPVTTPALFMFCVCGFGRNTALFPCTVVSPDLLCLIYLFLTLASFPCLCTLPLTLLFISYLWELVEFNMQMSLLVYGWQYPSYALSPRFTFLFFAKPLVHLPAYNYYRHSPIFCTVVPPARFLTCTLFS